MKRSSLLWVFSLFSLVSLLPLPGSSYARTWLVRQDGSGDCTTIQACVDSTSEGDSVLVGPGTYAEHVKMPPSGIRGVIVVSDLGPAVTVIRAPTYDGPVVCVFLDSVLSGFTLRGGRNIYGPWGAGGAYVAGTGTLRNCLVVDNRCEGIDSPGYGAVYVTGSGTIEGNTIVSNGYWVVAGGIYCGGYFNGQIVRNVVALNADGYGIYCEQFTNPTFSCNDVWGNPGGEYGGACGDPTGTNGNISVDPLFCDFENGDYRLGCDSPCLNAPGCGQVGALGAGCGPTAVRETTWGRFKALFR